MRPPARRATAGQKKVKGDAWIWKELGIPKTDDVATIRRAYAARLKAIDTEAEPEAFIALREARDRGLTMASTPPFGREVADDEAWLEDLDDTEAAGEPHNALGAGEAIPVGSIDDPPALDIGPIERIDFLLFTSEEPVSPNELEGLTRSILDDPAVDNIEVARWVEGWIADRIARAMPVSDPMIEAAIAHFGWNKTNELSRAPVIDYILQRREDRLFEIDLQTNAGGYNKLMTTLREAPPTGMGRLAAWWRGIRMEYLIAYLQTFRPTVLRGLNPETLNYWYDHIEKQSGAGAVSGWLRALRRKYVWRLGLFGADPSAALTACIALVALLAFFAWIGALDTNPSPSVMPVRAPMSEAAPYSSAEADIAPLVRAAFDDEIELAEIETGNPRLYEELMARWQEARDSGEQPALFRIAIRLMLEMSSAEGLRGGSYELQRDYWRLHADEVIWARRYGNLSCASYLSGGPTKGSRPQDLVDRRRRLMAKALLEVPAKAVKRRPEGSTYSIPNAIFEAAVKRSGLKPEKLAPALLFRGTPGERCIGRIAIIEAALEQPRRIAAPYFRDMSSGL